MKSAIDMILEHKMQSLASGERIEISGFGSFNVRHIAPRIARNPKTGEEISFLINGYLLLLKTVIFYWKIVL